METCVEWLKHAGLAFDVSTLPRKTTPCEDEVRAHLNAGHPVYRCVRKTAAELCELRKHYRHKPPTLPANPRTAINAIWYEFQNARSLVSKMSTEQVPADAMACYLPFHVWGERWGIYLSLSRILYFAEKMALSYSQESSMLGNLEIMLQCALFEMFHHEYFHHIVESTVTTLEIVAAALGTPQPLYFAYRKHDYESRLGAHPHRPLEEALATAYSYDAFAPIARSKIGCRTVEATLYRELMSGGWPSLSAGYREAGQYVATDGNRAAFASGTAQLAAMILNSTTVSVPALAMVADRVMPRPGTAFCSKSTIPIYMVGPDMAPSFFLSIIPAPRETCMRLYSPRYTRELDEGLRKMQREIVYKPQRVYRA